MKARLAPITPTKYVILETPEPGDERFDSKYPLLEHAIAIVELGDEVTLGHLIEALEYIEDDD